MAEWSLVHAIDSVDRSSAVFGETVIARERNAQAVCRFAFRPPDGAFDQGAYIGLAVTVHAVWDTDPAVLRFTGVVESAEWDALAGLLRLTCVDGLKAEMRARTTAQVLALMAGARWREECFGTESDGWEQFREAVKTLDYSYFKDAAGVDQWVSRKAKVTPDHVYSHAAGEILEDSVAVTVPERESLVNRVTLEVQARGVILHHWELGCSWSAYPGTAGFCPDDVPSYYSTPWFLPTREQVSSAVSKAGWRVKQHPGLITVPSTDAGGIRFTGLPESGSSVDICGDPGPWVWILWEEDKDILAVGAEWTAVYRWEQTCRRHYTITVEAPDGVVAHGEQARANKAGYDEGDAEQGWASGTGAETPSGGNWTVDGAHYQSIELDQAEADEVIECAVAVEAADELDSYRQNRVTVEPLAALDAFGVSIADTVRVVGAVVKGLTTTATGTVEQIDERWDPASAQAGIMLTLGVSRCPGAGGTDDPIAAPAAPSLAPGYTLDTSLSLSTYIGGQTGAPVMNTAWRGYITNMIDPDVGSEEYAPRQMAVEYPARPIEAKETLTASATATYRVYPPHDELTQVLA